jgi:hypothetical protein
MTIRKNKITKISIVILMLLLSFSSVKYYKVKEDFAEFKDNSELEVKILKSQLGEILHKYDSLSEESKRNAVNIDARSVTNESTNKTKTAAVSIDDSKRAQKTQVISKDSKELNSSNRYHLTATNINAKGVKIYSDLYKSSNSQIQQLRVCYTLQKNEALKAGSRKVYIQVVNPKNQIISKGNAFVENASGTKLQFSALSEVNYNKKDTDVCAYVDLEENKTIKGSYIINIYSDFTKIGSTTYEYK